MKVAISYGTSLDDSDYLSFNIKNIELYKFLNDLGIKIKKENDSEIVEFARFEKGEGIEKKEENFAEEVMKQLK